MVQRRSQRRRHGRSTDAAGRDGLRNVIEDEALAPRPLGTRLRARFAGLGLEDDEPETLPAEAARPESLDR